jgi:dTDP-4-dehydrorhamnose 3,5-epimerase
MHFHLIQTDLWVVIEGRAIVGLTDLRSPIADSGWRPQAEVLAMEAGDALLIPPRIAHGFYAPDDLSLLYLVTREFDATDEFGFAWDDPMAGLPWPVSEPVVSARDRANPPLRDALQELLGQAQSSGT